MSEPFPTPGIHTGPVPPLAATDPDTILSDHPEVNPGDGCRVCGKTHTHEYGCRLRRPDGVVRAGDTFVQAQHRDADTAPTLGALANYMALWKEKGVTAESVAYAAGRVWPDAPEPVSRVKRERDEILEEAARLISGDREDDYGSARDNFARTGQMWAAILGADDITAEQVALMLATLKISRLSQNTGHRDSWVDLAGYAALGGDIAEETAADAAAYAQR